MNRIQLTLTLALSLFILSAWGQNNEEVINVKTVRAKISKIEKILEDFDRNLTILSEDQLKEFNSEMDSLQNLLTRFEETNLPDSLKSNKNSVAIMCCDNGFSVEVNNSDSRDKDELPPVDVNFLLLNLGVNTYLFNNSINLPGEYSVLEPALGKSINVQFYPFKLGFSLVDHHVNLHTGLGIEYNNYHFAKNVVLNPYTEEFEYTLIEEGYKKYKLASHYLFIPLELNFETNPEKHKRSFRYSVGARAGILARSYSKMINLNEDKTKIFDDFNLSPFQYGLTTSIGYGFFNLYANYNLNNLFRESVNPELTPVSFGIVLNGFKWD